MIVCSEVNKRTGVWLKVVYVRYDLFVERYKIINLINFVLIIRDIFKVKIKVYNITFILRGHIFRKTIERSTSYTVLFAQRYM